MIILGYKPLDEKSVNFIIDNYYKLNYDEISEKLNISKSRVFAQCSELRKQGILKEKKKRYTWSFEDEELLKKMVENNLSIEDISSSLFNFGFLSPFSYLVIVLLLHSPVSPNMSDTSS